jgi:hypothetical protein
LCESPQRDAAAHRAVWLLASHGRLRPRPLPQLRRGRQGERRRALPRRLRPLLRLALRGHGRLLVLGLLHRCGSGLMLFQFLLVFMALHVALLLLRRLLLRWQRR